MNGCCAVMLQLFAAACSGTFVMASYGWRWWNVAFIWWPLLGVTKMSSLYLSDKSLSAYINACLFLPMKFHGITFSHSSSLNMPKLPTISSFLLVDQGVTVCALCFKPCYSVQ